MKKEKKGLKGPRAGEYIKSALEGMEKREGKLKSSKKKKKGKVAKP